MGIMAVLSYPRFLLSVFLLIAAIFIVFVGLGFFVFIILRSCSGLAC